MSEESLHIDVGSPKLCFASLLTVKTPGGEEVVEGAAVRFVEGRKAESFTRLACIGAPLPLAFQKLTGLDDARLRSYPGSQELLRDLARFVGRDPVVVADQDRFNRHFDELFLGPTWRLYDLGLLARITMPEHEDYSVAGLAEATDRAAEYRPRALSEAMVLARLWEQMLERVREMPQIVLWHLVELMKQIDHPLMEVLNQVLDEPGDFLQSGVKDYQFDSLFPHNGDLLKEARNREERTPTDEPLPTQKICAMFEPEGEVGRELAGYEKRDEQQRMAAAVCEAYNTGRHLMVEAGTGTGKSMAYLIPSIAWSMLNDDRVVISTCTKNLQSQLYTKDIPFLHKVFSYPFRTALVKGRKNYLCVRKFVQLLAEHERELAQDEEYLALMPTLYWASETESGDVADCNGLLSSPMWTIVWDRISSTTSECPGAHCPHVTSCFVRKNRALAQLADVIIANHSMVFSSFGQEGSALSGYRCIVFDEAHNVEDVATDCLSRSLDRYRVYRCLWRLYRTRRGRQAVGMLPRILRKVRDHLPVDSPLLNDFDRMDQGTQAAIDAVQRGLQALLDRCGYAFEDASRYVEKRRFRECGHLFEPDGLITNEARTFCMSVKDLSEQLRELAELLEDASEVPDHTSFIRDLSGAFEDLEELVADIQFIFKRDQDDHVYWIERTWRQRREHYSLHAAPVSIGKQLSEMFFPMMRSVVMSSATLAVGGDFTYMAERLGLNQMDAEELIAENVGSPFDFESQCRLCVPTFLPNPGGQRNSDFDERLSEFLVDLLGVTEGRGLVLFTAYSLLDHSYQAIKPELEAQGIPVIAQGRDGTREAITNMFRKVRSSVLLGTQSFWEGVDVVGEALSCLVVTKLPFQVFTEPLIQARCEYLSAQGKDPFRHYSLPNAVIRLRQGFGRLIRTRTDRGVVVITDRRLVEKSYGRYFLGSLPVSHQMFKRPEDLLAEVGRFLRAAEDVRQQAK